jgi:hypothetical protein
MAEGAIRRGTSRLELLTKLRHQERVKQEDRFLEMVHLKIRTLMRDGAAFLKTTPVNRKLQDRLRQLEEKLADLDRRAPWIAADYPVEMSLWGPGAGLL